MTINEILLATADLFYPRLCICCGSALNLSEKHLCASCFASLPRTNFHLGARNLAEESFAGKAHATEAFSWFFFSHDSSYSRLIYDFKYNGNYKLAEHLGRLYSKELRADGPFLSYDYIIPVPLHRKRKRERGYNQSFYIAKGISSVFGGTIREDILFRGEMTKTQTKKMRFDRWENIKDAFFVDTANTTDFDKKILIVDDVTTSGATIAACIIKLRECGFKNISVLTLAYTSNSC